jgi:hypothetical protein
VQPRCVHSIGLDLLIAILCTGKANVIRSDRVRAGIEFREAVGAIGIRADDASATGIHPDVFDCNDGLAERSACIGAKNVAGD